MMAHLVRETRQLGGEGSMMICWTLHEYVIDRWTDMENYHSIRSEAI